jgi:hypothetical protein
LAGRGISELASHAALPLGGRGGIESTITG